MTPNNLVQMVNNRKSLYIVTSKHGTGIVTSFQKQGAYVANALQMVREDCIPMPEYSMHETLFPKKEFPDVLVISEANHNEYVTKMLIQEYKDKSSIVVLIYDDEDGHYPDYTWLGQSLYDRAIKVDIR